jgi:hypothetical protein
MILLRQNQSTGKLRHLFLLGETRGIIFAFAFLLNGTYIQTLPRCLHSKHLCGPSTSNWLILPARKLTDLGYKYLRIVVDAVKAPFKVSFL